MDGERGRCCLSLVGARQPPTSNRNLGELGISILLTNSTTRTTFIHTFGPPPPPPPFTTLTMPGPLYGRWVPPNAKSKDPAIPPPSSHKAESNPPNAPEVESSTAQKAASPASPPSVKKPKKRKRDSNVDQSNDPIDESTPKKHKSILSKFQKVSQKAQKLQEHQQPDADTADASTQSPAEVLRGTLHSSMPGNLTQLRRYRTNM